MKFISLKKRIENAITPRMEPKGFGDNPEELRETNHDNIYVSIEELLKIINMRKCTTVAITSRNNGYTEESIQNDQMYVDSFFSSVFVTKKQAKLLAGDYARQSSYRDEPMLLKVGVYGRLERDGSFTLHI